MSGNVVILGSGVMAQGIALEAARYGHGVTIWYPDEIFNPTGSVDTRLARDLERAKITPEQYENIKSNIIITDSFNQCSKADLIIECIVEDFILKSGLFKEIENVVPEEAIICTNTSSLSINELSQAIKGRSRFAGLHFFNPVDRMNLVEIVKGRDTSDETVSFLTAFIKSLSKDYVIVKDSPGFIVNRLLFAYLNNAAALAEQGVAGIEDIDMAMRLGANHPLGPFDLCDLIGMDTVYNILRSLYCQLKDEAYRPSEVIKTMVEQGKLGKKAGEGFYKY